MPTNLVKSKQDEADWAEARRIVDKQYPDKSPDDKDKSYWKLTTSIYENIKKNRGKKQMQKQASVGELLAAKIHLRKTAGDDRQYTVFLRDWIAEQYKNGRDPVEEMRRISQQQQPAGAQQPQGTSTPNQAPAPKQAPAPQQTPAPQAAPQPAKKLEQPGWYANAPQSWKDWIERTSNTVLESFGRRSRGSQQPAPQTQSRPGSTQTGGIGAGIKNRIPGIWRPGTAATAEMPVDAWLRQQQHPVKPSTLEMPADAWLQKDPQTKRNLLDYNM